VNAFYTENPCSLCCVRQDDVAPQVGRLRHRWRLAACLGVDGLGWLSGLASEICSGRAGGHLVSAWARACVSAMGVRVVFSGPSPKPGPALVVANHVSPLDAIGLLAVRRWTVVSFEEMRDHPTLGRLLRNTGTVFVRPGSLRSSREMVVSVGARLRAGGSVLAFPEGKIRCSAPGGPFSPAVMQGAIDAQVPVRPVLLSWELPGHRTTSLAAWFGEESQLQSLARIRRIRGLTLKAQVLADIAPADGQNRRELADAAWASVAGAGAQMSAMCPAHPAPGVRC
jgi:1-acyl-sn-glycerol-3-phosphate acyltransferase